MHITYIYIYNEINEKYLKTIAMYICGHNLLGTINPTHSTMNN